MLWNHYIKVVPIFIHSMNVLAATKMEADLLAEGYTMDNADLCWLRQYILETGASQAGFQKNSATA